MAKKKSKYENEDGYLNAELILEETKVLAYITSARSIGKTYGFLKNSIENGLSLFLEETPLDSVEDLENLPSESESKCQFFFLRRTIEEIKVEKRKLMKKEFYKPFLDSINEDILKEFDCFEVFDGSSSGVQEIYLCFQEKANKKNKRFILLGYMAALSAHKKIRGGGYPVELVIFDEFQADEWYEYYKGNKEPAKLIDIYESITRNRAGKVPLICLGNAGTILNPHFAYYKYTEFEQEKTVKKNGTVIFYHLDIVAKNKKGDFADLIEGTTYGEYSTNNKYGDMKTFNVLPLESAKGTRKCLYNIVLMNTTFGVWVDGEKHYILSRLNDPELRTYIDHLPSGKQIMNKDVYITMADKIANHFLYFDTPDIRLQAEKHLQRYVFRTSSSWETAK